jgi:exodeoxyribonuclease VII large subunit
VNEIKKLSVSEITILIKQRLEEAFSIVHVQGELSNCKLYPSGHIYFTLKDSGAVISAVMFKNSCRSLKFQPKDGKLVLVSGQIQVYPPKGNYQLVAGTMEELAGTGDILAMLERRKQKFAEEGLFDEARKKAIPRFPETVGVVTSPGGAAIRDILQILSRRAHGLRVIVLPCQVQGAEAAPQIARRIEQANFWNLCDVLIVGRGGGAIEDLLPFSEEIVVRSVSQSKIPVISAIGHEIDWAICDYAADLRAPTPSAAAELVSESRVDTLSSIRYYSNLLKDFAKNRFEKARLLIKPFSMDDLERRFRLILQPRLQRFDDANEMLLNGINELIKNRRTRLAFAKTKLESANPHIVLERGYSVVTVAATGKTLKKANEVHKGEELIIRPLEGEVRASAL